MTRSLACIWAAELTVSQVYSPRLLMVTVSPRKLATVKGSPSPGQIPARAAASVRTKIRGTSQYSAFLNVMFNSYLKSMYSDARFIVLYWTAETCHGAMGLGHRPAACSFH